MKRLRGWSPPSLPPSLLPPLAHPRCTAHLKHTCAGVLECSRAMAWTIGLFKTPTPSPRSIPEGARKGGREGGREGRREGIG
jgi:hypothetical protein